MSFARRFGRWCRQAFLRLFALQPVRSVSIAPSLLEDLSEMARSAHPKEMLAFLAASRGNQNGHVHIDELQLQAYDASEDSATVGLHHLPPVTNIVGTVHSHPGASARPSDADLHLFSTYGTIHAILPEPYLPRNIVLFNKRGQRIPFAVSQRR